MCKSLAANGIHEHDIDNIEMIALHKTYINYTSLKDLLTESPPSTASPTFKDPLLQHAAWAYLQPMSPERMKSEYNEDHRCWKRFNQKYLCWLLGCFTDVVLVALGGWCPDQLRERLMIKLETLQLRFN